MRRVTTALGVLVATAALAACSVTPPKSNNSQPSITQLRDAAGIAACTSGQTTDGGLPDVTLPCLGGGTVDLSTLKGPLLINAWATTCAPCREEMPALEAFHQKYGAQLPILGVDYLDTPDESLVVNTAKSRGATYPIVIDADGKLGQKFGFSHIPATFLLTADGKVKLVQMGGMNSLQQVEQKVTAALGHPL